MQSASRRHRRHPQRPHHQVTDEIGRCEYVDSRQVVAKCRPGQSAGQRLNIDLRRSRGADKQVVRAQRRPDRGIGEYRPKGRNDAAEGFEVQRIGIDPYAGNPAFGESGPTELKVLAREQIAHAGDPGIRGFGDDDVVRLRRYRQEVAPIVNEDVRAGVVENGIVEPIEVAAGLEHARFDLHAVHGLQSMPPGAAEGDPAGQADNERPPGVGMQQKRNVCGHGLRRQVARR